MKRRILFVYKDYTLDNVDNTTQAISEAQEDTHFVVYHVQEEDAIAFIKELERVEEILISKNVSAEITEEIIIKYKGKQMS